MALANSDCVKPKKLRSAAMSFPDSKRPCISRFRRRAGCGGSLTIRGSGRTLAFSLPMAPTKLCQRSESAWEISIEKALGKLKAPDDLDSIVDKEGFAKLEISFFHAEKAGELRPLHRDSFDRMLIAQAQAEGLDLVTNDAVLATYGLKIIDASR